MVPSTAEPRLPEHGRKSAERILKCMAAFAVSFYSVAVISSAIDIYALENYDPYKFRPDEAFRLHLEFFAVMDAFLAPFCFVAAFGIRGMLVRSEPFWRALVLFAVVGACCVFVIPWILMRVE